MIKSWLGFLFFYSLICAVPALVLWARGRGWRPRFLLATLLLGWTGGGWVIMLWLAVAERSGNFSREGIRPAPGRKQASTPSRRRS